MSKRGRERRGLEPERPALDRWQKSVVALGLLVLILGLGNLGQAGIALRYAIGLPNLPLTVSWSYLMATGIFWGLALAACSFGLVRFRPWGRWATLVVATGYEAHVWIDHLLFDANDYARQTWPRDLTLTAVFLAFVWGLLNWPSAREVFRR